MGSEMCIRERHAAQVGVRRQHRDLGLDQAAHGVRQPLRHVVHRRLLAVHHPEPVTDERVCERGAFADRLAALADAFVSDGFGVVHRKQASVYDVAQRLPHAMGGLVATEIDVLRRLTEDPERPYVVVLGGSKVSDKLGVIDNLLGKADKLLIGGGMVFTFLKAQGHEVGASL